MSESDWSFISYELQKRRTGLLRTDGIPGGVRNETLTRLINDPLGRDWGELKE
jgi:hypothetical protein